MKYNRIKRILSAVLCAALLLSYVPVFPFSVDAASDTGAAAVTTTIQEFSEGLYYNKTLTSRYLGNRMYSVQIDLSASVSSYDHARVRTASRNGYITIEQSGYYLLELWGGKGANGQSNTFNPGGDGANGGYVFGKVYLHAGQTLAYNIGTNGTQSTSLGDGTGGFGGDSNHVGGTHGELGSRIVGAGGGYSAVYLFNSGEFKEEYITDNSFNIPETARLSRYLMIAGGGGGGGAAAGGLELFDSGAYAPNGGAGGNINRGISISMLGDSYDVPGYVFSGRNGASSGDDLRFIGRGGSNVPGAPAETEMGRFTQSQLPNDWTGTRSARAPGAGGSGNFRGGGGGSGYAGGSGGLMEAQTQPWNVGGGGGGSSFIAQTANNINIEFLNLTGDERAFLSGATNLPDEAVDGGAVQITFLGEDELISQEALNDITITGNVTDLFEIDLKNSRTNGSKALSVSTTGGASVFTAAGLSVIPASSVHEGKKASVTLIIKTLDTFAGGNSVPMINSIVAAFASPNDASRQIQLPYNHSKTHSYVNVPLNMQINTHSYVTSIEGKSYSLTQLYDADYNADTVTEAGYSYIRSIGSYEVYEDLRANNHGYSLIEATSVTSGVVGSTRTFEVRLAVEPMVEADPEVKVGPALAKPHVLTGKAVISVVKQGSSYINGLSVTGVKNLAYNNGNYEFSISTTQISDTTVLQNSSEPVRTSDEWFAPEEGWYYIQVWGGNGGSTNYSDVDQKYYNYNTAYGGTGGDGGYVCGYVYLIENQYVKLTVGSTGSYGSGGGSAETSSSGAQIGLRSLGGGGGTYSSVSFSADSDYLLIAGGGGGAGGSASATQGAPGLLTAASSNYHKHASGPDGKDSKDYITDTSDMSLFNGLAGTAGNYWFSSSKPYANVSAGTAGTRAGSNFKRAAMDTGYDTTGTGKVLPIEAIKYASQQPTSRENNYTGGQIAITLVSTAKTQADYQKLMDIEAEVAFTKYFNVTGIQLKTGDAYSGQPTKTENADGSVTLSYKNASGDEVAKFTYKISPTSDDDQHIALYDLNYIPDPIVEKDGTSYSLHYESNLEFKFILTPKEGFLGGNDVPLLAYGETGNLPDTHDGYPDCGVKITQGEEFINLPAANATDYANVAHSVDLTPYLEVQDKTIHLGDSVQKNQLYTFTPPVVEEDWMDDFAHYVTPGDTTYRPTETTVYDITIGFAPNTPATKATIVGEITQSDFTLPATVYVETPVTTSLTNLIYDGESWTLYGETFFATLRPVSGYVLPDEITVTVNSQPITEFSYNSEWGTIQLDAAQVTGPIHITAKAKVKTYVIHFVYYTEPIDNAEPGAEPESNKVTSQGYPADTAIDWTWVEEIASGMAEVEGYHYVVSYDSQDGSRPATMPGNDLWVYGSYEKQAYNLTVNYVYKDSGAPIEGVESYQAPMLYGDSYSVVSPAVKGYRPETTIVSGTMGASDVTVTVEYVASTNELIVIYQKADGTEAAPTKIQGVDTNASYAIVSPEITGYTPDIAVVEGTMTGAESETFVVTYYPKTYTVTFNYTFGGHSDATLDCESDTRLVQFGNTYSYNATTDTYDGLPTAYVAGYTFEGWYRDQALTDKVTDSNVVSNANDETLYAKWDATKFKLTVRYDFLYEEGDYIPEGFATVEAVRDTLDDVVVEIPFGDDYNVDLPAFVGYSAYENYGLSDQILREALTGTMPGQNKLVVVTYDINIYTIRFMDLAGEHVSYSDQGTSKVASDAFNVIWGTVQVKHDVPPVFEDVFETPHHDTRAEYTYAFTGWYGSDDQNVYTGRAPQFPKAVASHDYYAMYDATENIVSVNGNKYFTCVSDALAYAQENLTESLKLTFRRNNGNGTQINLNDDVLAFDSSFPNAVTIDLNGCSLHNTLGQKLIANTSNDLSITLQDMGAGGRLEVTGDGDVVTLQTVGDLTMDDYGVTIKATSNNGDATAIRFGTADVVQQLSASNVGTTISATAPNGTACGIDLVASATVSPAIIKASGNNAVGINVAAGMQMTLSGTAMAMTVQGQEQATGICVPAGATLVNTSNNANVQTVTAAIGDAYGIRNEGTITSVNLKMAVNAQDNAYGLYNNAGTVTVIGVGTGTDLRATGAQGYGLYNVANGTAIGTEDGDKLSSGAFAGSTYGIHSEDGDIFLSGNYLYFKGADLNSALGNVVYDEAEYHEVDATEQFENGYYRLAAIRTITFVVGEGATPIETVVLYFDEQVDKTALVTTKRGYTFSHWSTDQDGLVTANIPDRMPAENVTLYAQWSLNNYQYALDKQFKKITIEFYMNTTTNEEPFKTVILDSPDDRISSPDVTRSSTGSPYIHTGWYTTTTPYADSYVSLNGDISEYADENNVLKLYAGWKQMWSSANSVQKLSTTEQDFYLDASVATTSSSAYYMYFVAPKDGSYTITYAHALPPSYGYQARQRKYFEIRKYYTTTSGSSTYSTVKSNGTVYTSSTITYNTLNSYLTDVKAGEVIVLRTYHHTSSSSYTGAQYDSVLKAYVTYTTDPTFDSSEVSNYAAYSVNHVVPVDYNVTMGDNGVVDLDVPDGTGHEGMKFAGWAESEESQRITQITPEMVDTVPQWQNGELWQLYSQWEERTWSAYQSSDRDFTEFETTAQVNILGNESVSVRFKSTNAPEQPVSFRFDRGLPSGTILTLIDRSGDDPVYYTYTITQTTKELSSTVFTKMGSATTSFSGIATDLVLQICYENAPIMSLSETVSIYAGDVVSEADATYTIIPWATSNIGSVVSEITYEQERVQTISLPSFSAPERLADYKVLLRVRWDDLNLAPGSQIMLNGMPATIYDGQYAMMDTGLKLGQMTSASSAQLSVYLPTMMQNEFTDKNFYYELCIAPDANAVFGAGVIPLLSATDTLTLSETPSLTVGGSAEISVEMGQRVNVEIGNADADIYLYQQNSDGSFHRTDNCATIFQNLTLDENGKLSDGENALIANGAFTAAVSANAVRGQYYLVIKLGDKYERILLKVTAATTTE